MWGAIAQAAAQTNNTIASTYMGAKNFGLQKENLAYLKQTQQTSWDREDSAVQRRTQDLKAAGLSPVLAAGQGASTMAPIKTDAPQADPNMGQVAANMQQMQLAQAQIAQTKAGTEASHAQANLTKSKTRAENLDNLGIHPTRGAGITRDLKQLKSFMLNDPHMKKLAQKLFGITGNAEGRKNPLDKRTKTWEDKKLQKELQQYFKNNPIKK